MWANYLHCTVVRVGIDSPCRNSISTGSSIIEQVSLVWSRISYSGHVNKTVQPHHVHCCIAQYRTGTSTSIAILKQHLDLIGPWYHRHPWPWYGTGNNSSIPQKPISRTFVSDISIIQVPRSLSRPCPRSCQRHWLSFLLLSGLGGIGRLSLWSCHLE